MYCRDELFVIIGFFYIIITSTIYGYYIQVIFS